MATKTVSSNYAEATYSRDNADDMKINVPHLNSDLTNQEIADYMNDFVISMSKMCIAPPKAMESLSHVVSTKTYYGV